MELKDAILKYGGIMRKRKRPEERIRFLSSLQKDFEDEGFDGELYQTVFRKRRSISLYCGDVHTAKTIIMTHYDNPLWFGEPRDFTPFNEPKLKRHVLLSQTVLSLLVIGIGVAFYTLIATPVFNDSSYGFLDMLCYVVLGLLLLLVTQITKGIETSRHLINNTASVLVALSYAQKLDKNARKDVAFVFVDGGCKDRFGYLTFRDYYTSHHLTSKVVVLDMVGSGNTYVDHESFVSPVIKSTADTVILVGGGHVKGNTVVQEADAPLTQEAIDAVVDVLRKL